METASTQEEDANAPDPVNTGAILDMQRKLFRWSRNDPEKVFSDLFNLVCDRRTLMRAWNQLSKNQGSRTPGVDGVTRHRVEKRAGGVGGFLEEVRRELRSGTYQPQPVRQRLIPKPGKPGKFRPLGIPTLRDRLVQMALKIVLEPIFEADFYPTSYGFRRGRSTLDALAAVQRQLQPHSDGESHVQWVIEGDIKGCFDNIDHHRLMERVRKRIQDRRVLRLIRAFLKADIMVEGNARHPVAGTPQGGIISPLLANIYLTAIEERYRRWITTPRESPDNAQRRRASDRKRGRPTFYLVRYADDFVILVVGTREDAEAEKAALSAYIRDELRMELSLEKTLVTEAEKGFEFLGYRVIKERAVLTGKMVGKLRIPKGKLQLVRDRLKAMTSRSTTGMTLEVLLKKINPIVMGWHNYYRYATGAYKDFRLLDWWLWHRIRLWLRKRHSERDTRTIRRWYERRESPKRWTWAAGGTLLARFTKGGTARYRNRGVRISNGWNDEMDQVRFYKDTAKAIFGFTLTGELVR